MHKPHFALELSAVQETEWPKQRPQGRRAATRDSPLDSGELLLRKTGSPTCVGFLTVVWGNSEMWGASSDHLGVSLLPCHVSQERRVGHRVSSDLLKCQHVGGT